MTQEEIDQILKSKPFLDFFGKTTKLIEKAVEGVQVEDLTNLIQQNVEQNEVDSKKDILSYVNKYYDQQYSENRVVTALEWSDNIQDCFLTGYSSNEEGNINDPVGVILVWSLQLKSRPEFHCFCQSQVTSACFYPFSNNLIIGGLYNGQVSIWDLRAKTAPILRSTQEGHAYPIYSIGVIGTENAHQIVSISNDGNLCIWSMNDLTKPQRTVYLKKDQDINVTCMSFKQGDSNNFFIGSESGKIYQSQLHQNQEETIVQTFQDHLAPITSLSINSKSVNENSHLLNGLMITTSYDWTIKLWNPKVSQKCILTMECDDYVYDASWNPQNPTVFASGDSDGYMSLWDLTDDYETPIVQIQQNKSAVNKVRWNNEGAKLLAGECSGVVNLYNMNKNFLKYDKSRLGDLEELIENNK